MRPVSGAIKEIQKKWLVDPKHTVLGITKKIVDWMVELYAKLESLGEEKTKGHVTYQLRQLVVETWDNSLKYG